MEDRELGKITSAEFGTTITTAEFGTNDDRPFLLGIWLGLSGPGWGVGVSYFVNMSENCKWESEAEKAAALEGLFSRVHKLLADAKVNHVSKLVGKPVEFKNPRLGRMSDWDDFRILTEVL